MTDSCERRNRYFYHEQPTCGEHYGLLGAGGLSELRIAGRNIGGLDRYCYGAYQQLLQAAGPECHFLFGAAAFDGWIAGRSPYLSSAGAAGSCDKSYREHRGTVCEAAA